MSLNRSLFTASRCVLLLVIASSPPLVNGINGIEERRDKQVTSTPGTPPFAPCRLLMTVTADWPALFSGSCGRWSALLVVIHSFWQAEPRMHRLLPNRVAGRR